MRAGLSSAGSPTSLTRGSRARPRVWPFFKASFVMVATPSRKPLELFGRREAVEDARGIMGALLVYSPNPAWRLPADGTSPT